MKNWMKGFSLVLLLAAQIAPFARAETPEEKGLAIAVKADQADSGWSDSTSNMTMILRNRNGDESIRKIRSKALEVEGDGDKALTIFDEPKDVQGTAFLSFTHSQKPDEQWLYLPALKRVKRISSKNKSGPFMGSEFAFEDLTSQEVDRYTYKWLRDEELDGKPVYVIERYPTYENSGYTRQVAWVDKKILRPLKIEFYDRKDALMKTLTLKGYRQYKEKFWRPDSLDMINHQTGKSTTLTFSDYQFSTGLSSRDFDRNALKRAR